MKPESLITHALNEIAVELSLHRMALGAVRMGVERGDLSAPSATTHGGD